MNFMGGRIYSLGEHRPVVDPSCYIAPGAMVIGQVRLGVEVSVWFNAVLRGDLAPIEVGAGSNIQDNSTIHVEGAEEREDGQMRGTKIGRDVTIGHNCVVHSCVLEDGCLIGMGAIVMGGAIIGREAIVGAGSVVLEGMHVPPHSLAVGNPARIKRTYPEETARSMIARGTGVYRKRIDRFKQGLVEVT